MQVDRPISRILFTSKGSPILLDEEDWLRCMPYFWCESPGNGKTYIQGVVDGGHVLIHRFILEPEDYELVDHRSGDTFDNRRCNLRIATSELICPHRVDRLVC